ncbi:hypothetical protein, partial [Trichlorobacter lovleyi]|uniref:hypothetical protein n=1 Tax=Trichlorobacter lovleyi TaxID=313985 RepID=UPI0023F49FB0
WGSYSLASVLQLAHISQFSSFSSVLWLVSAGAVLIILKALLDQNVYLGNIIRYLTFIYSGFVGASFFHYVIKPRRKDSNSGV